jgi:cell division protein FtsL
MIIWIVSTSWNEISAFERVIMILAMVMLSTVVSKDIVYMDQSHLLNQKEIHKQTLM